MPFGPLQRSKSYRQLWRRPQTYIPPVGRGGASLVLGSDADDETATMQTGDLVTVSTSGDVNDAKQLAVRGAYRLNAAPPAGYGWEITFNVDGWSETRAVYASEFTALLYDVEFTLDDVVLNVTGLGTVAISFTLEFVVDPNSPGPGATDVDVVLPSVWIDQVLAPETVASNLYVSNRSPEPNQTGVWNGTPTIDFVLSDTNGTGIDLSNTTITVDGVVAYTAGAFSSPWTGSVTATQGPTGNDTLFSLTVPAANLPYDSEQTVQVNVVSELTGGLSPIDTTWSFVAADTTAPAVQTAVMIGKRTLRVSFTDDMQLDTETGGVLNPANYSVSRVSSPAASLTVVSVTAVNGKTDAVDLTFNTEASFGAEYVLAVSDVEDDANNPLGVTGGQLTFFGYQPPRPEGRRFELLDFIATENLRDDLTSEEDGCREEPGTGDLRKFVSVLQEVVNVLLCAIDEWTNIIDIDLAPEPFLDAILQDLGNPFADCIADLSENDKRRLARILISIYKQKGTTPGVINAVRFFLGVSVTLDVINFRQYWQIGVSQLDLNTYLAPPVGSGLWYSFFVVSPVVLTDEQRDRVLCIAEYMKGVQEHVLGIIEPGDLVTQSTYWVLNESLLGADPAADPSTILA